MGDRIAVMYGGQIQQLATPLEIYNHPANVFVAQFIGSPSMNLIPVEVKPPLLVHNGEFRLTLNVEWEDAIKSYYGKSVLLGIRSENFALASPAPKNLCGVVEAIETLGSESYLSIKVTNLETMDVPLQVRIPPDKLVEIGEEVWLSVVIDKVHLFDRDTTMAIH